MDRIDCMIDCRIGQLTLGAMTPCAPTRNDDVRTGRSQFLSNRFA
jgi:hypothetical protein